MNKQTLTIDPYMMHNIKQTSFRCIKEEKVYKKLKQKKNNFRLKNNFPDWMYKNDKN